MIPNRPYNQSKVNRLGRLLANFPYYRIRAVFVLKLSVLATTMLALRYGSIYYAYGPEQPRNYLEWSLMKRRGQLTEEQLWKEKVYEEWRLSNRIQKSMDKNPNFIIHRENIDMPSRIL